MMTVAALTGCNSAADEPADTMILGAEVWTGVAGEEIAEALAVRNGRVVAVGPGADLAAFVGPDTRVIDAGSWITVRRSRSARIGRLLPSTRYWGCMLR